MNLNVNLSQLDLKDVAGWPSAAKAGLLGMLFAAVLGAGYWFDWKGQLEALDAAAQRELTLRESFMAKKRQAVNLDAYVRQLEDVEQAFSAMLKQLPDRAQMDALLNDINQAGLGRGLAFELFKPGAEKPVDFYAERPIEIRVSGSYHDLGAFASDLARLPRIVTLHDVSVGGEKDGRLAMGATVKTYRYLDENEIAAQKTPTAPEAKT